MKKTIITILLTFFIDLTVFAQGFDIKTGASYNSLFYNTYKTNEIAGLLSNRGFFTFDTEFDYSQDFSNVTVDTKVKAKLSNIFYSLETSAKISYNFTDVLSIYNDNYFCLEHLTYSDLGAIDYSKSYSVLGIATENKFGQILKLNFYAEAGILYNNSMKISIKNSTRNYVDNFICFTNLGVAANLFDHIEVGFSMNSTQELSDGNCTFNPKSLENVFSASAYHDFDRFTVRANYVHKCAHPENPWEINNSFYNRTSNEFSIIFEYSF